MRGVRKVQIMPLGWPAKPGQFANQLESLEWDAESIFASLSLTCLIRF
jgi:hypothetical protein